MISRLRRLAVLSLLLAALPSLASAQQRIVTITHGEAMTQDPEILATRAVGPFGELYAEVTRPYFNPRDAGEEVWFLTFATHPRAMNDPGLCEAGRLDVDLRRNMPVQPFTSRMVYRVFGDTTPGTRWSTLGAKAADPCQQAGPVIWSGRREDEDRPVFFLSEGDEAWIWHGVRGLKLALETMKANPTATPCEVDQPIGYDCAALRRFAGGGHTDQLRRLDADFCVADPRRLCVRAWLHLAEPSAGDETVIVSFDVDPMVLQGDVRDLQRLSISKPGIIYD